jgi:DNA-binding PadR family transcriptional regulator
MNEHERRSHHHAEGEHPEHRFPGHARLLDDRQPPPRSETDREVSPGVPGHTAQRDEVFYVVLDALRDRPKSGFEVIRAIVERSFGGYMPSPSLVYPTLQYFEELGFLQADSGSDRRIYRLTDAGRTELDAQAEAVDAFWTRWDSPISSVASQSEVGFLQDELDHLKQAVWSGLRRVLERDDHRTIRQVRLTVQACQNEIRQMIAEPESHEPRQLPGDRA